MLMKFANILGVITFGTLLEVVSEFVDKNVGKKDG